MFVGVNWGYSHDLEVAVPSKALEQVKNHATQFAYDHISEDLLLSLYPATIIYRQDWGCPESGEPVAFVLCKESSLEYVIKLGEYLRQKLNQTTVSVIQHYSLKCNTLCFECSVSAAMNILAKEWQLAAESVYQLNRTYVSCGFYELEGKLMLQSALNPKYIISAEAESEWVAAVNAIVKILNDKLLISISPSFSRVSFTYLQDDNLPNSRGLRKDDAYYVPGTCP